MKPDQMSPLLSVSSKQTQGVDFFLDWEVDQVHLVITV